jgi:hypothetical protein
MSADQVIARNAKIAKDRPKLERKNLTTDNTDDTDSTDSKENPSVVLLPVQISVIRVIRGKVLLY